MAQFIDETGGELEEMNLQSAYEKTHAEPCFQRARQKKTKPKSHFSPVFWCQLAVESEKESQGPPRIEDLADFLE